MANEFGILDHSNEELSLNIFTNLEGDALQEKLREFGDKYNRTLDTNRQLFARAKKAEGFEQNEKGEWVKIHKPELKETKSEAKPEKSDEELLKRLDKVLLRSAQITHEEDVGLFDSWKERTKMDSEAILVDDIFQAQLEKKQTARKNQEATSDVKGEGGVSGAKSTPEYWIGKATTGSDGKLMFPDDLPSDRILRAAIMNKLMEKEKTGGKTFYNDRSL